MRNVGMIELSEDLPLDLQSRLNAPGNRPSIDYFDGHLLFELCVRPLGEENLSHTPDPQAAQHAIRPYAVSFFLGLEHAPRRVRTANATASCGGPLLPSMTAGPHC